MFFKLFSKRKTSRRNWRSRSQTRAKPRFLSTGVESLEQRWTPAQYGIPWVDSPHLTVSFVPDGTTAAGQPSALFAALDAQMPRATWQSTIVRAAQTWANMANINMGLRSDQGQPIGESGPAQGDSRFGDIRIVGLPMASTESAIASPPSTAITGTFSGDIFFNTAQSYTQSSLFAVALHEFGHALGLDHSDDPTSVMFAHFNSLQTLSPSDVTAIRDLYGVRSMDLNESAGRNNSISGATRIAYTAPSGTYDGSTPLIAYGDLHNTTDVDYFEVKPLLGYSGPMTVRVQTTGISFMAPKLTIVDRAGNVLGLRQSTATMGDTLSLTLPNVEPDKPYYIKVEGANSASLRIGRYGVAVTFDGLVASWPISIDSVLRGRYETLPAEKIGELFRNPFAFTLEDDLHTDDTTAGAVNLRTGPGNPLPKHLVVDAALSDATDVDMYRVRTPTSNGTWIATITLRALGANGILPTPQLFDGNNIPVPTRIIANGNKSMSIEASGIAANRSYFVRVASPQGRVGNYTMSVDFGTVPAELTTFVSGSVTSSATPLNGNLYIARTQLMNFVLEAAAPGGRLTMTITNSLGQVVQQLTVNAGNTVSSISTILAPGAYTVTFTATARASFVLRGNRITDPIGAVIDDGTLDAQYTTDDPDTYMYVNNIVSTLPYLWLLF